MSEPETKKPKRRSPRPKDDPRLVKERLRDESVETRKTAALILEVLAGLRSTSQAAEAIGVSVPRYYALEARALEGLVAACRPRRRGPSKSLEKELAKLRGEVERLERECARSQALLRIAQRAVGVKAAETPKGGPKTKGGKAKKGRRKKRPTVRALRAVNVLREGEGKDDAESTTDSTTPRSDEGT